MHMYMHGEASDNSLADDLEAADRLITEIDRLHSAPQIAQQVMVLTQDPDFDIRDVAACLEKDPALAARILRVVNSSRYGLRNPVTNIRQAASYIGQRSIRLITLTFGLVDKLARGPAKELYAIYWQRAITMAAVASRLTSVGGGKTDDAYTAGLLADIGMLIFAQLRTEQYTQLCQSTPHGPDLVAEERRVFGFGHPALGARLLETWSVPDPLVSAVICHHETDANEENRLVLAVRAGDLMADALWTPNSTSVLPAQSLMQKTFGIDTDGFIDLALSCRAEIDEAAELFGVRVGVPVNCDTLIEQAKQQYADISLQTALELDSLVTAFEEFST